jgi:hypothetical protein
MVSECEGRQDIPPSIIMRIVNDFSSIVVADTLPKPTLVIQDSVK